MPAGDGLGQALVIAGKAAEAGGPDEGPLDYSSAREQNKTPLGFRGADHAQGDAVGLGGLTGDLLDGGGAGGQFGHPGFPAAWAAFAPILASAAYL
jgi:hypothetical protein